MPAAQHLCALCIHNGRYERATKQVKYTEVDGPRKDWLCDYCARVVSENEAHNQAARR